MALRRLGLAAAAASVGVVGLVGCGSSTTTSSAPTSSAPTSSVVTTPIVIGSQNFTENEVLADVYADALKADGFADVTVKSGLGSREVTAPALASGAIDMIPEYLGNYLTYVDPSAGVLTVAQTAATLTPIAASKGLVVATYSAAADSDAIAVTTANATKYHLSSISDLAPEASKWILGGPPECATRITCLLGLKQYYGLTFASFKSLDEDGPLTVAALEHGTVQVARIFSSDATISQDHFTVLSDPKDFQGAGNIVPIIRKAQATPAVLAVCDKVSAALTTQDLVMFNLMTGGSAHDLPADVAQQFVTANKL